MENIKLECFNCEGDGEHDGTYPECNEPASACCGGCYVKYECETCNGSGELYPKNDEIEDIIIEYPNNYTEQMLYYSNNYSYLPIYR